MPDYNVRFAEHSDIARVKKLLSTNSLPHEDIESHLSNFILAEANGELAGVAGVELSETAGLLRS